MPRSARKSQKQTSSFAASPTEGEDNTAMGNALRPAAPRRASSPSTEPPATPDKKRRSRLRSGTLDAFATPDGKKQKTSLRAIAVTPEEDAEHKALSKYVPKYIHKNLDYKRRGEKDLPAATLEVYRLVCDHYEIPENFEQRRAYGPLSGTSHEERVIQAYSIGKLSPKHGDIAPAEICTCCATLGHKRFDCPTLI